MKIALAFALVLVAGCHRVGVQVSCARAGEDIECTVTETEDHLKVKACWDTHVACEDGSTFVVKKECEEVSKEEGPSKHVIVWKDVKDSEKCKPKPKVALRVEKVDVSE